MKDYYKVLGVSRDATDAQIKVVYRRLIKACHPDRNSSCKAAEWTRELNEAYETLSDAQARISYDIDLQLEEKDDGTAPGPTHGPCSESEPQPQFAPEFYCDRCNRMDPTLRYAATWRVFSFITYTKRCPTEEILCNRCRVKESLAASATTVLLGWWSILGFFWTLEALFKNSVGGEQSADNNFALLNALGCQLDRAGKHQEAYEALVAAFRLNPNATTEEEIRLLRLHHPPAAKKPFWVQFRRLELQPFCYHSLAGAVGLVLLFWVFNVARSS